MIKDFQQQRKLQLSNEKSIRSSSTSPKLSVINNKTDNSKHSVSRVEEEKERTNEALKEINKLQELEAKLIGKLKQAYENQKNAESKVTYLINHPVIASKEEFEVISSQRLSESSQL